MPYFVAVQQVGIEEYCKERLTAHTEIPAAVIAAVFQFTNALKLFAGGFLA